MKRTVILHYHLFKNAGTSVDRILKRNFGDRWVTAEFPTDTDDNSALVADWIATTADAVAFSTHTAIGPPPKIADTDVITLALIRDPIDRIRSAYAFEREQDVDNWGANLAKAQDLEGYVRTRLARPGDRQCRNFQTHRLASLVPGTGPERDRAIAGLRVLSVLGLVAEFDATIARLADRIRPLWPDFAWTPVHVNNSAPGVAADSDADLAGLLAEANSDDIALLAAARKMIAGL
jgi:hypothetical protein